MRKAKKTNVVVFNVPPKHADSVRRYIEELTQPAPKPKPIKRVRKIDSEELKLLAKDIKAITKRLKAVEKEVERLEYDYDDGDLLPGDQRWVNAYLRELMKVVAAGSEFADIIRDM